MDFTNLKEILVPGRELILNLGSTLSKYFPFSTENIAAVLVLALSFWIANSLYDTFFDKDGILIKLFGTGAIFWILWIW